MSRQVGAWLSILFTRKCKAMLTARYAAGLMPARHIDKEADFYDLSEIRNMLIRYRIVFSSAMYCREERVVLRSWSDAV